MKRMFTTNLGDQLQNKVDVACDFIIPNARVIAEDVIAYCQLNLAEKTKSKEYIETFKP